jgi:zinc transporter
MSGKYSPMTTRPQPPAGTTVNAEPTSPGLIEGFRVHGDGHVERVTDAAAAKPPRGGFLWLHIGLGQGKDLVANSLDLQPIVVRSLLATETRPRCQHLKGGTLINLRGVNLNEGDRPEDMLSLRCWLEANRLITVRLRKSIAVEGLRERYAAGDTHERAGSLLVEIIRQLLSLIDPVADGLADSLDRLEDEARKAGDDDALREVIAAMRHDAVTYHRYLAPMRDAISKLSSRDAPGFAEIDLMEAQEEADRATRIVEELDITIDRAGVIVDQMAALRSERMNRNMMVLSVISAVFLPLGFLTGLLGINVGGLPGTDSPYAFGIVVVACLLIGTAAGFFFKARDWF